MTLRGTEAIGTREIEDLKKRYRVVLSATPSTRSGTMGWPSVLTVRGWDREVGRDRALAPTDEYNLNRHRVCQSPKRNVRVGLIR